VAIAAAASKRDGPGGDDGVDGSAGGSGTVGGLGPGEVDVGSAGPGEAEDTGGSDDLDGAAPGSSPVHPARTSTPATVSAAPRVLPIGAVSHRRPGRAMTPIVGWEAGSWPDAPSTCGRRYRDRPGRHPQCPRHPPTGRVR
jgi:hypothetical protein